VADYRLAKQFLEELSIFEKSVSARDIANLDQALAAIVQNPNLPRRISSFYNPAAPSYLYRAGTILIHYRLTESAEVEFLNLFWRRI
jgi:hypothetical protein